MSYVLNARNEPEEVGHASPLSFQRFEQVYIRRILGTSYLVSMLYDGFQNRFEVYIRDHRGNEDMRFFKHYYMAEEYRQNMLGLLS